MSKEQTPINKAKNKLSELFIELDKADERFHQSMIINDIDKVMEQYAQTKVLEYEKQIRLYWIEMYAEEPPVELKPKYK